MLTCTGPIAIVTVRERRVHAVGGAARHREDDVLQQHQQAEGREDLHHRLALQRAQDQPVHGEPEENRAGTTTTTAKYGSMPSAMKRR